jgi:hypothetical protein
MSDNSELLIISRVSKPGKRDRHWVVRIEQTDLEMFIENVSFHGAIIAICNTFDEARIVVNNIK